MAGYTRNDTTNQIADGNVINAAPLDGEFNAIESAFNVSSGHTHDGSTTGDGAPISKLGPSQETTQSGSTLATTTDITVATNKFIQFRDSGLKILSSADGQLDIDADTELEVVAPTVDIDASTAVTIDTATLTITGAANVTGDLDVDNININGNTIISTDTNGNIALTPNGTGEVDISKVDIDSGAIDAVTLGTNSPVTEAQIDNININGNAITSTDSNGNIALTPNGTGEVDISKVDIAAGEIDGVTIGTNSAVTDLRVDNIKVDGNAITSTDTDGDITITPNGNGKIVLDGLNFPIADGTAGHFLKTDGSGQLSFAEVDTDLSGDSSPQLGGMLDVNGNAIGDGTLELIKFTETGSAVNEITIANAATGGHPLIQASGDDTNINLKLDGKGSGVVNVVDGLTVGGDLTVNGTTTTVATTNTVVSDSLIELANGTSGSPSNDAGIVIERGSSANAFIGFDESEDKFAMGTGTFTGADTGNLSITKGTLVADVEGNVTGNVTGTIQNGSSGDAYTFPASDGSNGQVLQTNGSGALSFSSVSAFTSGMILPFAGSSAPTGWLLSYGQAVSRTTYASLFTAIGTTYGSGDGATTFNLPDLRGRVVAGQDDMGGVSADNLTNVAGDGLNGDTLGATGGSENHVLTTTQLASHSHGAGSYQASFTKLTTNSGDNTISRPANNDGDNVTTQTYTVTGTSGSAGSGAAHNNVQPTIILNYIIKT